MTGRTITHYRVAGELGQGGMGVVYRAEDIHLERTVALKFLHSTEDRARLLREAKAAAALNHPNICSVHEVDPENGFIAMEYVDGTGLDRLIGGRPLPAGRCVELALQLGEGLRAAHERGLVHRDVKSGNVMVTNDGRVKILDFGLARHAGQPALTRDGLAAGTPGYMAPELLRGGQADRLTDIWAFGAVLHEMLTGSLPVGGIAACPAGLDRILRKALASRPEDRYQHLGSILADLRRWKSVKQPSRIPVRAIAAATVLLVMITVAAFWFQRRRSQVLMSTQTPEQVTFDAGISAMPEVSPDSQLLAYASDRAGEGNLDIWLRRLSGANLLRLTTDAAMESDPQFSADGSKLYYLKGGEEIYEMPSFGGPSRKIASSAGPFSVSRDGEIVFLRLSPAVRLGKLAMQASGGGSALPWIPDCRSYTRPVWSSDSSRVYFIGQCGENLKGGISVSRDGSRRERAFEADSQGMTFRSLRLFRLRDGREGLAWSRVEGTGIRVIVWTPGSEPRSLMTNAGMDIWPQIGNGGEIVFARAERSNTVQRLSPARGSPLAEPVPERVAAASGHFAISKDGTTLAYGRMVGRSDVELVIRDEDSGSEKVYAAHQLQTASLGSIWPQVSPKGERVFYRTVGKDGGHFLLEIAAGDVRKVASLEKFQLGSDWSPDGKRVLGECPPPKYGICELDPLSGAVQELAVHAADQLVYPSWSWDGRSVVFARRRAGNRAGIWIAKMRNGRLAPESDWIEVVKDSTDNHRPRFSPDGQQIWFVMGTPSERALAVQRIDRESQRAVGEPVRVLRTPLEQIGITTGFGPFPLVAVTAQRVYFSTIGLHGDLWLARLD